jgi:hypothetical protein
MNHVRRFWGAALACVVFVAGCAPLQTRTPPGAVAAPDGIETTLYLIGDAGEPLRRGDPVLAAEGA